MHHFFNSLLGVWKCDESISLIGFVQWTLLPLPKPGLYELTPTTCKHAMNYFLHVLKENWQYFSLLKLFSSVCFCDIFHCQQTERMNWKENIDCCCFIMHWTEQQQMCMSRETSPKSVKTCSSFQRRQHSEFWEFKQN